MQSRAKQQSSYCGILEPANGPVDVVVCARATQRSVPGTETTNEGE